MKHNPFGFRLALILCIFASLPCMQTSAFPINFADFFEKLPHITLPFSLAKKGHVLTTDFKAGEKPYTYSFYISFNLRSCDPEQLHRVAILLGLIDPNTGQVFTQLDDRSIPIPLKLTVIRLDGEKETVVYNKEVSKTSSGGGTNSYLPRGIDSIKLEPALYRVRLETLAAVPELADIPVNFEIGLPGKH